MRDVQSAAETAVRQCADLRSGESCTIVTDDERSAIGEALYDVAREITRDTVLVRFPPGPQHGAEPPAPVAGALAESNVFLAPTTMSLSHTRARGRATEAGARGATLPGITEDVFVTGLDADYERIHEACTRMIRRIGDANKIRVTSSQGTDITFEIGTREWQTDTGIIHEPGSFSNLPAGEVFVSPESAHGTYVVDGTIRPHGLLDPGHEIRIRVEDGYAIDIDDATVRDEFEAAAEAGGRDVYNVAELGIGTNHGVVELVGSVLLDEKAAGTVHIALGDDASIGGDTNAPIHADGVLRDPTVYADGNLIELPKTE